jgi:hypothetical protein
MGLNSTFGTSGTGTLTSIGSMRASAALLTQRSAANIEIAPKTAAMPIIVTALPRTPKIPVLPVLLLLGSGYVALLKIQESGRAHGLHFGIVGYRMVWIEQLLSIQMPAWAS